MKRVSSSPHRVVVKVGSSLIDSEQGHVHRERLTGIAESIDRLRKAGVEVVLVSSGAVGAGRRRLDWKEDNPSVVDRQALAAVGQPYLMRFYEEIFGELDIAIAQVLLTRPGLEDRRRYLNARHTMDRLLALSILPIVNENDTVVTDELQFGDNDRLAALVAGKIQADLLILLTDVEAVWDREMKPVGRVTEVGAALLGAAKGAATTRSRGGMKSKLIAVQEAMLMGCTAVVAGGREDRIIDRVLATYPESIDLSREHPSNAPGSWFISQGTGLASRKRWILSCRSTRGTILVDDGARAALEQGNRSLLPSGVVSVEGTFLSGEPIGIASSSHEVFAQGLANLSSDELLRFRGMSTREVRETLPQAKKAYVAVHHDDMVLMREVGTRD